MSNVFRVRGMNIAGTVVEVHLLAPTEVDAKAKAEQLGMRYVVVRAVDTPGRDAEPKGSSQTERD